MSEFDLREDVTHWRYMLRQANEMVRYYERRARDYAERIEMIKREDYEKTRAGRAEQ